MVRLISTTSILPKSLFVTDVKAEPNLGAIGIGGFGRVFRGEYRSQQVALKVVDKGHNDVSPFRVYLLATVLSHFIRIRSDGISVGKRLYGDHWTTVLSSL